MTQTAVQKPTTERFSSGKPKPRMERGSGPAQSQVKRGCYICGERSGGNFTASSDFYGRPRAYHSNSIDQSGKAQYSCETTFKEEIKRLRIRAQEEKRQDDLLAAAERKYNQSPPPEVAGMLRSSSRDAKSQHDIYDCPVQGCRRFFDSDAGVQVHRRRGHKKTPAAA